MKLDPQKAMLVEEFINRRELSLAMLRDLENTESAVAPKEMNPHAKEEDVESGIGGGIASSGVISGLRAGGARAEAAAMRVHQKWYHLQAEPLRRLLERAGVPEEHLKAGRRPYTAGPAHQKLFMVRSPR